MPRSPFGWDYPAGAENDPSAPYNQEDPPECVSCGDLTSNPTSHCKSHSGPVCSACRCPDCPAPDLDEPPEPDTPTRDLIEEDDPDA